MTQIKSFNVYWIWVLIVLMNLILSCNNHQELLPIGKVSDVKVQYDFGIINGEHDAGFSIAFTLVNEGAAGTVTVIPKLSCSEGAWTREQKLIMEKGETRKLSFFFHEPSLACESVRGEVEVIL